MKYGKSNIDIIKDYLAGERPFVQVGYVGESNKYRKEGEAWVDSKGIEWERKGGRNVRLTKTQGEFIRELTKQKCKCGQDIRWGTRLDNKFFNRTGLCEKCLVDYETKLRLVGVYDDYEHYKLTSYELGVVRDAKAKLEDVIKFFSNNSGDVEVVCNSEGFIERWKNTNREQIIKDVKADLKLARKRISELTKQKTLFKKKYEDGARKYQLETYAA